MTPGACALIPVYDHHRELPRLVRALHAQNLPVILVDDGSGAETRAALDALAAADATRVQLVHLARNRGKGAAVIAGLEAAARSGYTHALQIDADGQHDPDEAPALLAAARETPQALVSGAPRFDRSIPRLRFYSRYLTHVFVWLETLSLAIADSMCGFRVYPVAATLGAARGVRIGRRMDFDTEIMVRLFWAGVPVRFVPVSVRYPADGVSHFRFFEDNARITWMHTRLVCGMLLRLPRLLRRRARRWDEISEAGSYGGMRLLAFAYRHGGRAAARLLLAPAVAWFFLVHGEARRGSRIYLAAVHGTVKESLRRRTRPTAANVLRHLWRFAAAAMDKYAIWAGLASPRVEFPNRRLFLAAVNERRGMLLLSAHLGNLDLCRAVIADWPDVQVNALVYTGNARKIGRLMKRTNPRYRVQLLEVDSLGPETGMLLGERIAAGEMIALVGDRTPLGDRGHVVRIPFLGRPAPFAVGPYVLAHALACPIYLFFCVPERGGYVVYFEPFAERVELPRGNRTGEIERLATRYAERLEHYAGLYPLEWFNFYDFWADPGAPESAR